MNICANYPSNSHQEARVTPILNHDILLTIFKMNTDMFLVEAGCLKSLRHYSQICTDWRAIILQTPSLWGQTIDFNELLGARVIWRDEVLRRSQDSLLWIHGSMKGTDPNWKIRQYLEVAYTVLDKHWGRIEKLHLEMPYRLSIDLVKWSSLLSRPSPCLKLFGLASKSVPRLPSTGSIATSHTLFANSAPVLREYHANPLIGYRLDAPWLKHLRVLHLEGPNTLQNIFQTIQATPFLEILRISCFFSAGTFEHSRVKLPFAKEMHIHGFLSLILALLENIEIPNSCAIQLTISEFSDADGAGVGAADLTQFTSIARSIAGYMEHRQPVSVSIKVSCIQASPAQLRTVIHTFSFNDISPPWMPTSPRPIVSVSVRSDLSKADNSADVILKYILDQYQSLSDNPSVCKVTHLDLTIDTSSSPSSLFTLAPLLSSLSSVKSLRLSDRITLNPGQDISDNVQIDPIFDILFPSLKKIELSLLFIQPKGHRMAIPGHQFTLRPIGATEDEGEPMKFICTRSRTGWIYDFAV